MATNKVVMVGKEAIKAKVMVTGTAAKVIDLLSNGVELGNEPFTTT